LGLVIRSPQLGRLLAPGDDPASVPRYGERRPNSLGGRATWTVVTRM